MGNELFKEVTDLTGLPESLISKELVSMLGKVGSDPQAMTLEDLRSAMATYLMEVIESLENEEQAAENVENIDAAADPALPASFITEDSFLSISSPSKPTDEKKS